MAYQQNNQGGYSMGGRGRARGRGGSMQGNDWTVGHQDERQDYPGNEQFRSPPPRHDRGRPNPNTPPQTGQHHKSPSPSPNSRNRSQSPRWQKGNDWYSPRSDYSPQGHSPYGYEERRDRRGNNYRSPQQQSPQGGGQWNNSPSPRNYNSDQGAWGGRQRDSDSDVHLSKKLSFLLRHGAEKEGFQLMPGGFLFVDDILRRPYLKHFKVEDVERIVANNDKQRFALKINPENKRLMIRANQGHTIEVDDLDLKPITSAGEVEQVIHGTYFQSWEMIKRTGLSRMGRNHIHFAAGEPGENGVISGMRSSCEVIIILNLKKALADGLKFFRSANNVILSAGDSDGIIYPAYFDAAIQRYPRQLLQFDNTITKESVKGSPPKSKKNNKAKKRGREEENEVKQKKSEHREKKGKKENQRKEDVSISQTDEDAADLGIDDMFISEDSEKDIAEASCAVKENTADDKEENTTNDKEENIADDEENTAEDKPMEVKSSKPLVSNYDADEDDDESEDASDVKVEEEYEIIQIDDNQVSVSAVDHMFDQNSPVAVCCYGDNLGTEDGNISHIMCVNRQKCYLFCLEKTPSLMTEGKLHDLLTSKDFPKVFYGCGKSSKTLFQKFEVLLDGTDIFDTKVVYELMKENGEGNMNEFAAVKFCPDTWSENLTSDIIQENPDAERDRCVAILQAYELMKKFGGLDKNYKRYIFGEVNSCISKEAIKEYKHKNKAKQTKPPSDPPSKKSGKKKSKK